MHKILTLMMIGLFSGLVFTRKFLLLIILITSVLGVLLSSYILLAIASILSIFYIAKKLKTGTYVEKQVFNILHAEYTFARLGFEDQKAVMAVALVILSKGGVKGQEQQLRILGESNKKYSLYALAMAELGITPKLEPNTGWFCISNPIIISEELEKKLDVGRVLFNKKHKLTAAPDVN